MQRLTEQPGRHRHLETKSIRELLTIINQEDQTVPQAVAAAIPQLEALAAATTARLRAGGRLFYIGSGTSGRLGILDASECPPTYGVPHGMVVGLIAGGDGAIRKAVEQAEDSTSQAILDLKAEGVNDADIVVGIAASGTTPYVIHGLRACRARGIATGCITCNPGAPIIAESDYPVVAATGPEVVTGSTRMKAGTAQKLVLNMLTTSVMIQLGRVQDNRMVDMQLTNDKLVDRGTKMVQEATGTDYAVARQLLLQHGSVRAAVAAFSA